MTDRNDLIVREQQQTEAEIQQKWKEHDQARRQRRLNETWPNRSIYEEQLRKIQNVNSKQGLILLSLFS